MLDNDLLLKNNELCLVGHSAGHEELHEGGLYVRDTRFLSRCALTFAGLPLSILELQSPVPDALIITATNATLRQLETTAPAHTVMFRIQVALEATMRLDVTIRNFGRVTVAGSFDAEIVADFRDMFDVRGMTPVKRPRIRTPDISGSQTILAATGVTGDVISTRITAPDAAQIAPLPGDSSASGILLRHPVTLAPGDQHHISINIAPEPLGEPLADVAALPQGSGFPSRLGIASPSARFNAFISRCDADLSLLQTTFPNGTIPAAGIPWFIAPFGRDSLIVALQTMPFHPTRVANTLRLLASLQGTSYDQFREEQPGKILHEMRYGEMARTGQAPHSPYYGSIDSTPLFVMTFAHYYRWHRDEQLYTDLIGNVRRALSWIESDGDMDGDGLLEYPGAQIDATHISQQGWKDSGDSLNFADGRPASGPIALVEVQGYVYAAYAWLAEAARLHGDETWAVDLEEKANRIRDKVESSFWMEDQQFYAQALDGKKRQVDAISSNPGHLLFCRLPSQERADAVARRFAAPDMNAGWGIRTLSSNMATYNPMSYHNGSIWPHDTSLAMAGLHAYGHLNLARTLAMELETLASGDPLLRIAELYCGFANARNGVGPVNYPVSCIPQAWAAASGMLAITTLLGVDINTLTHELTVSPHLPDGWEFLDVDGFRIGDRMFDIRSRRVDNDWAVAVREG
ncbi:MAG TPA: glycogen debranching N-terminal domain-containing protein [Thermomicrobiales bacterium]|nr:glycogen debranching N-terminal domain-containing protein [Thermomicrobiales bacterium]